MLKTPIDDEQAPTVVSAQAQCRIEGLRSCDCRYDAGRKIDSTDLCALHFCDVHRMFDYGKAGRAVDHRACGVATVADFAPKMRKRTGDVDRRNHNEHRGGRSMRYRFVRESHMLTA